MRRLNDVLKSEYGEKVYKISLSSGCTCPNRDGTVGYGGCSFCSEGGSGDFAAHTAALPGPEDLEIQFRQAKELIQKKTDARKFIAYFQSFTNTYGDIGRLTALYEAAASRDDVVILSLGTRPDCLGPEVMDMLKHLNSIKPLWIELGLQTIHQATADQMNRGYDLTAFRQGYDRLKAAGIPVIIHVIFGFPEESRRDMLDTIQYLSDLPSPPEGIKIQMLHILKNTRLGARYEKDPFPLLTLEEYGDLLLEALRILPPDTVLHRMTGDGPKKLLLAPDWTRNKRNVLNTLNRKLKDL